jgi:hypothetical protein
MGSIGALLHTLGTNNITITSLIKPRANDSLGDEEYHQYQLLYIHFSRLLFQKHVTVA